MQRSRRDAEADYDDDDVPLHHKRPFGSGLKRKRVEFVPAQDADDTAAATALRRKQAVPAGDLYASIVMGRGAAPSSRTATGDTPPVCPVCSLAVTTSAREHEASLAHQASLSHSHPPSALDRSRMGLRALSAQGWDPDARRGLGREGEGMRFPIKVAAKEDTLGVGATLPQGVTRVEKPRMLSAKEMKAAELRERQRGVRLQGEIFGSVDVERYLRGNGEDDR